jgi:hypothetical protein
MMESKVLNLRPTRGFKGARAARAFDIGPAMSAKVLPTRAHAPAKQPPTRATP